MTNVKVSKNTEKSIKGTDFVSIRKDRVRRFVRGVMGGKTADPDTVNAVTEIVWKKASARGLEIPGAPKGVTVQPAGGGVNSIANQILGAIATGFGDSMRKKEKK